MYDLLINGNFVPTWIITVMSNTPVLISASASASANVMSHILSRYIGPRYTNTPLNCRTVTLFLCTLFYDYLLWSRA